MAWPRRLTSYSVLETSSARKCPYRSYEVYCLCGCLVYHVLSYSFGSILYRCIYGCVFCMLLFNFVHYVSLLLCIFRSGYWVSLCCSVYCLCVNVYCTAATVCQPIWVNKYIDIPYHIISYHIISYRIISYRIISYIIYYIISYIISYRIISYRVISYHILSYIISYRIVSYHIISYLIMSYRIVSYHIIPYHIISYFFIWFIACPITMVISYHILYHVISYHNI